MAERKVTKVPPPAEPARVGRQPGRANRGFRSVDPERQRESGDASGQPATGNRPRQPAGGDDGRRPARRTGNPEQAQEPGSA